MQLSPNRWVRTFSVEPQKKTSVGKSTKLLFAVLVIVLLVGFLAAIFYFQRQSSKAATPRPGAIASSRQIESGQWEGTSYLGTEPDLAVDGNFSTRWASTVWHTRDNPQHWLELHYRDPQELSTIKIYFEKAYASKYSIETWNGNSWETKIVVADNTIFSPEHQFPWGTTATKIRINFTGYGQENLWEMVSVYEIVINSSPFLSSSPMVITPSPFPIPSVSAVASSADDIFQPELAIDGRFTTRWASLVSDQQPWLEIDYRDPHLLSAIKIYFSDTDSTAYNLATWNGDKWVTQITEENNTSLSPHYQFAQSTSTTKLRLNFSGHLPWNRVSIFEIVINP